MPLPIRQSSLPSNTPILRLTQLTTLNGIQIQSAVFPQFNYRTDRPTDGIGDESVPTPVYALSGVEKAVGQGGQMPPPQILMQWGETRPLPQLSNGINVYGATKIR